MTEQTLIKKKCSKRQGVGYPIHFFRAHHDYHAVSAAYRCCLPGRGFPQPYRIFRTGSANALKETIL